MAFKISLTSYGSGSPLPPAQIAAILLKRLGGLSLITDEELAWMATHQDRNIELNHTAEGFVVNIVEGA